MCLHRVLLEREVSRDLEVLPDSRWVFSPLLSLETGYILGKWDFKS